MHSLLTTPIGNNAFSYQERKKLGSDCCLRVPAWKHGTIDDIRVCTHGVCLEEIDHRGQLQSCAGLDQLIWRDSPTGPDQHQTRFCIIDNHNHAFDARYTAQQQGLIGTHASVVHIDQHSDMRPAPMGLSQYASTQGQAVDSALVHRYTSDVLNVGNFILPAQECGMIDDVVQIRSLQTLMQYQQQYRQEMQGQWILDIDVDFWAPEMGHSAAQRAESIALVRQMISSGRYRVVTIALSPYFIDIDDGISIVHHLFSQ